MQGKFSAALHSTLYTLHSTLLSDKTQNKHFLLRKLARVITSVRRLAAGACAAKRKPLLCLALCAVLGTSALAYSPFDNTEMLMSVNLIPVSIKSFTETEGRVTDTFGVGISLLLPELNLFFWSPVSFLDIGANMQVNLIIPEIKFGEKVSYNGQEDGYSIAFCPHYTITLGPVARFNAGERWSFVISPGVMFRVAAIYDSAGDWLGDDNVRISMGSISFNLDLGGRLWLTSRPGYSRFGLAFGTDLTFPFAGIMRYYTYTTSNYTIVKNKEFETSYTGFDLSIYLGIVLNLGNRF